MLCIRRKYTNESSSRETSGNTKNMYLMKQ